MIKSSSNQKIDVLTKELVEKELLRYTIQLFKKTEKGLRPYGSGVLAFLHGTNFIITASHVADYLEVDSNQLYIRVSKKGFINVIGIINYTEIETSKGVDLAYIKISSEMLEPLSSSCKFLTIDKFSKHSQLLDGMNYCVVGFPENNIRLDSTQLETGASFYVTRASSNKVYEHYKLNKSDFLIIDMKGKGTDLISGDKKKINTHFYGISGCGLWFLTYNLDPNSNEYWISYKLIGIMTEFKKGKYFCLIANKIHLFLNALTVIEGFKFKEVEPK